MNYGGNDTRPIDCGHSGRVCIIYLFQVHKSNIRGSL